MAKGRCVSRHQIAERKRRPFSPILYGLFATAFLVASCADGAEQAVETETSPEEVSPESPEQPSGEDAESEVADVVEVPDSADDGVLDGTIRIAWLGDVTGPTASVQTLNLEGSRAYVEYLNQRGGILGRQVELIVKDDGFDNERGVMNVRSALNDDRVLAFVGMGDNAYVEPSIPELEAAGAPVIGPGQTTDYQLVSDVFFHNLAHYGDMADVAVARAIDVVGSAADVRMLVIRLNVPSGDEWTAYIESSLESSGAEFAGELVQNLGDTDYSPLVVQIEQAIQNEGVNYIALHGTPATAIPLLDGLQTREQFIPFTGIQGLAGLGTYKEGPAEYFDEAPVEGVHSFNPVNVDVPGAVEMADFIAGTDYEEDALHINFAHGWVNVMVLEQAILRAAEESGELTRSTLFEALRSAPFDMRGLTCNPDWTTSNHSPCAAPYAWDGSGLNPVESFDAWGQYLDEEYFILN